MTTLISPPEQKVIIENVSWQTYERLLEDLADRSAPRLTYSDGRLEIMSPTPKHEELNRNLAQIVITIALERNLDVRNLGSATFRREDLGRGFEPDSCFYIAHERDVRGKDRIDLSVDPPPDLVIEIDITSGSLDKFPIYAQIGVPEIWRYEGDQLKIYYLVGNTYEERESSVVLSGIAVSDLEGFLQQSLEMPSSQWLRILQHWAREQSGS